MDIDKVRRSFDLVAEEYAADFFDELEKKPFDRDWLGRFAGRCRAQGVVLEVGCGPGHVGRSLAAESVPVIGLDVSEVSLRVARRLNHERAFVAGDMQTLPIHDGACGGLVAFYSVIYFDLLATEAILHEFRRVLRPSCPLLLAVHAGEGAERFTDYHGKAIDITVVLQSPEQLASLMARAGFVIDEVEARAPYPFEHPTTRVYVAARAA